MHQSVRSAVSLCQHLTGKCMTRYHTRVKLVVKFRGEQAKGQGQTSQ